LITAFHKNTGDKIVSDNTGGKSVTNNRGDKIVSDNASGKSVIWKRAW